MKQVAGQVGAEDGRQFINARNGRRFPEPPSAGAHWLRVRRGWHPPVHERQLSPAFRDGALFVRAWRALMAC